MATLDATSIAWADTHELIYQSPTLAHPEDAVIIGLAEVHKHPFCKEVRDTNAAVIDRMVNQPSLLLFEGVKMPEDHKPLTGKVRDGLANIFHLTPSVLEKSIFYGWDALNRVRERIEEEPKRKLSRSNGYDELSHLLKESKKEGEIPSSPDSTLHALLGILCDPSLCSQYTLDECREFKEKADALIIEGFPERVEALVKALEAALLIRNTLQLTGQAWFIAGKGHVVEPSPLPDERLSLKSFYDRMAHLPIIILCPKKIIPQQSEQH